jgi:hypothetical protein
MKVILKRISIVLMAVIVSLFLVGCGGEDNEEDTKKYPITGCKGGPSEVILDALRPIYEDVFIQEAASYADKPGLHPLVLLSDSGEIHPWTGCVPKRWWPESVSATQLVALVGKEEWKKFKTCDYTDGSKIIIYHCVVDILLLEAQTGISVAKANLKGFGPNKGCPFEKYGEDDAVWYGPPIPFNMVRNWLYKFVEIGIKDGTFWDIETVDSKESVGKYNSLALDPKTGRPRISYYDCTNYDLKYASYNGVSWDIETIDSAEDVGLYTSLALDSTTSRPRISYYDCTNYDLKYASYNGASWDIETVDSIDIQSVQELSGHKDFSGTEIVTGPEIFDSVYLLDNSLALDPFTGNPKISYYNHDDHHDLKYASYNGSSWEIETVYSSDRLGGKVDGFVSLALDPSTGNPRISFYDYPYSELKYASHNGTSWDIETVDSEGPVGKYNSLALDPKTGRPRISYYTEHNSRAGYVKYASHNGTSWDIETIVSLTKEVLDTSLALDPSTGNPRISYYGYNYTNYHYDIQYASYNGGSWDIETVYSLGFIREYGTCIGFTSLALDPSTNMPRISYYDYANGGGLQYSEFTVLTY